MGAIMKQIEAREREKHLQTDEFIAILYWYIKACEDLRKEYTKSMNDLNEAFNTVMQERREKGAKA
jgi:hypothetical protein